VISTEDATPCVVGVLSAFWCLDAKGGESVGFASRVSLFLSRWTFVHVAFVCWFAFVFV